MIFRKTGIQGVYIIKPELKSDERGYFARIFCREEIKKLNLNFKIAQISRSSTKRKGAIRGMHFQKSPKAENKIVQCLKGAIYDVAIDLRKNSPTYKKWVAAELTEENKKMFLVPEGCAHGFQALKSNSEIQYFVSEFYSPEHERGIRWDDPVIKIRWPLKPTIISEKDKNWPLI